MTFRKKFQGFEKKMSSLTSFYGNEGPVSLLPSGLKNSSNGDQFRQFLTDDDDDLSINLQIEWIEKKTPSMGDNINGEEECNFKFSVPVVTRKRKRVHKKSNTRTQWEIIKAQEELTEIHARNQKSLAKCVIHARV